MLIKNVFYKELVVNAVRILTVLIVILPITELFKLLNQVAAGNIPIVTMLTLVLYGTLASFPMILNIACFLSIVITFNRMSKDHELIIWLSSGISPFYWLKILTLFVTPLAVICGICSMIITPWAHAQSQQYAKFLEKQSIVMALSPGLFKESPSKRDTFYIEKFSIENGYAQNLFLKYIDESNVSYNLAAKEGRVLNDKGIISLTLFNGNRYQLDNFQNNILIMHFKTFTAAIKQDYDPIRDKVLPNSQSHSTTYLIGNYANSAHNRSELSWRISIMLMTLVMGLLSMPISMQTSRVQSNLVFIFPPLIYGIYQNLVMTINAKIHDNILYSAFWTMPLHLLMIAITIGLTYFKSKPIGYFWSKNK